MEIKRIEETKQLIRKLFEKEYFKQKVADNDNCEQLKTSIYNVLRSAESDGLIVSYGVVPPKVKIVDNYKVDVDIMSAFRNFPKFAQEDIYCRIHNIQRDWISKFNYNDEGYISSITLKESIKNITITINIES